MGIFDKRQKQPALQDNIVNLMERFGRFEVPSQADGEDAGQIWSEWAEQVFPVAQADPESFLVALANATLPVGSWAVYGASRTLWEAFGSANNLKQHPSYNAIMTAAIEFLRTNKVPLINVRGYELDYWLAHGGTRETWLPQVPTSLSGERSNTPEAWVEIGTAHAENRRYTEALEAYDHALQINPAYAPAYACKADIFGDMQRYEQALVYFDLAIHFNPIDAGSYAGKGMALSKLQRYQEALEAYDHAIQIIPNVAAGYTGKADVLTVLGRYEEAIVACDQALQINPTYSRAYSNKGTALAELKRYREALEHYERACQFDPSDRGAYAGKALMLTMLHQNQ